LPEQDAVIAITSGVRDMQAVLNLIWDKLLPGVSKASRLRTAGGTPATRSSPLPPDEAAQRKLGHTLKNLSLHPVEGKGSSAKVLGKTYVFASNERKLETITLENSVTGGAVTLVARFDGVEQRISCGHGVWQKGRIGFPDAMNRGLGPLTWGRLPEQPVAASGAWTADDTFTAKLCLYETPFIITIRLKFSGRELQYGSEANVGFGPTKEPQLTGRAE
jgi:hypothetical protein